MKWNKIGRKTATATRGIIDARYIYIYIYWETSVARDRRSLRLLINAKNTARISERRSFGARRVSALSAADFWRGCVMGQSGGGQLRGREQSMLAISCSLRGSRLYNCYWQIVMPVISHGGDRTRLRASARMWAHPRNKDTSPSLSLSDRSSPPATFAFDRPRCCASLAQDVSSRGGSERRCGSLLEQTRQRCWNWRANDGVITNSILMDSILILPTMESNSLGWKNGRAPPRFCSITDRRATSIRSFYLPLEDYLFLRADKSTLSPLSPVQARTRADLIIKRGRTCFFIKKMERPIEGAGNQPKITANELTESSNNRRAKENLRRGGRKKEGKRV